MSTQSNPLIRSLAVPSTAVKCLPEGKRIVEVTIDFSALDFGGSQKATIQYPELSIGAPGSYQAVEVNLSKLQNSQGLSEVRTLIYYWRPQYGPNGVPQPTDFAATDAHPLLCTNINTLQTVIMSSAFSSPQNILFNGSIPFFGIGDTTVRFLNGNVFDDAGVFSWWGKGTFQFCNFDVPYYTANGGWNPSD